MQKKLKIFILLIVVITFFVFSIFFYQRFLWSFFVKDGQLVNLVLKDGFFASQGKNLLVEVAKDKASIGRGLSNREQLQTTDGQQIDGMLFIFPQTKTKYFWMKDMNFDIDICWFNKRVLFDCTRQILKPNFENEESELAIYQSPQSVKMVLETMPSFLGEELIEKKLYIKLF
jgi:uncharacterized membrane protein (UPF0127 family)